MAILILFNKPYGVLSQFTDRDGSAVLADYIDRPGVYPAGRLDKDSEGLLLLTDDGKLQQKISHPRFAKRKHYWVQVEDVPEQAALQRLRDGVVVAGRQTRPAEVELIEPPANLWPRHPPIRKRESIPTQWLDVTISEGRNRQVRKMTAAVGHPTLRLIRHRVDAWTLDGLLPGAYREIELA